MSEDIANVEADIEAIFAALELAGVAAARVRQDAIRLSRMVTKDPPKTRAEWERRAQLRDANGEDLGWVDTSKAKRIDLNDPTGAGDRDVPEAKPAEPETTQEQQGPAATELVELDGQFFEVTQGKQQGVPEQVRPISIEEAQARIQEHRPDLATRLVGEQDPRLEVTTKGQAQAGTDTERIRAVKDEATPSQQAPARQPSSGSQQPEPMRDRAWMAGVVAMTDSWEQPGADHDGIRMQRQEVSAQQASVALSPAGAKDQEIQVQLHRADGTVHVKDSEGQEISSVRAGQVLGTTSARARELIGDAGTAMTAGAAAFDARSPQRNQVAPSTTGQAAATSETKPPAKEKPAAAPQPVRGTRTTTRTTQPAAAGMETTPSTGPGQSAAEAFGGTGPVRPRGRASEPAGAPDAAEVMASSRMAGASASR